MKTKVPDSRQVVELKVFTPEDGVRSGLAGGACVQHVIQAELAVVAFLGWELPCLDNPKLQDIVHPPTVVLESGGQRKTMVRSSLV